MGVATLRILVLENSPADALSLRAALEQDTFARHQITLVECLAEGLETLTQESFDAILLDLDLPDSPGLKSIQRLQEVVGDLPIVVISGMTDETVALRAVQAGAQDFVAKNATGWAILARAIRYAIERHNLVRAIEVGGRRFATAFQRSPVGQIITTLKEGRIVDVNAAFCHMMEYKREDVLGRTTLEIDIWADLEERRAAFETFGKEGRVEEREVVFRTGSGELRTVLASVEPIEFDGERCVISTALDITERKLADEAIRNRERQLQALVSSLDDIVFEVDEWGTYRNVWTANESILFRPRAEIIGKRFDEIFGEETSRPFYETLHRTLESNTAQSLEYPLEIAGTQHWYIARYNPIHGEENTPRSVSILVRDITRRKQAELALQESEERFATTFFTNPISQSIITQTTGTVVEINGACCDLYGYSRTELIDADPHMLDLWANPADQLIVLDELQQTGRLLPKEISIRTKSGEIRTVLFAVEPISWMKTPCWITSSVDITERKRAEEKLQRSEADLAEAQRVAKLGNWHFDIASDAVTWSDELYQIFEVEPGAFGGRYESFMRHVHPDDRDHVLAVNAYARESGEPFEVEYRIVTPNKNEKYVREVGYTLMDADGQVTGMFGIAQDITERKLVEIKLRTSEERLRSLLDTQTHWVVRINMEGHFTYWNDQYVSEFGWLHPQADLAEANPMDAICPYHHQRVVDAVEQCIAQPGKIVRLEVDKPGQDGSIRTSLWEWVCLTDENDQPSEIQCMGMEITERKQAELLIATQRDLSRSIATFPSVEAGFQAILDAVLGLTGLDSGGVYLFDTAFEKLELAYHRGLGEEFIQAVSGYSMDSRNVQLILSGEPSYMAFNDPVLHMPLYEDEGLRSFAVVPVLTQDRVIGCLNLASHTMETISAFSRQALETLAVDIGNVVNHVRSQAALHASEAKYRGLVEATDAIVVLLDADGRIQYLNDKAAEISGIEIAEALGRTLHELLPEAIADLNLNRILEVFASGKGMVVESPIANGRTLRTSVQPVDDENGVTVMVMMSATDITDLKNAQQALQELNRSLEERVAQRTAEIQDLYDNAPIGYHSLDAAGRFIQVNQTELNWLGYTRDELIGRPLSDISTQESIAIFRQTFPTLIETGLARDIEFEFIRKDGSILPGLVNATVVYDDDGTFLRTRSTIFDNTKRKAAEQALRESEEQNRLLFENTPDAVVLFDAQGSIIRANQAFEELAGLAAGQWKGNSMATLGLLPEQEVGALADAVVQAMADESRPASAEFSISHGDGTTRTVGARIFGITIQGRRHYLTSMRDITIEKQASETLRLANLELERALRMKDEFLANMSHELRTPLTGILGLSELLQMEVHGPLTERQQKSIRGIEESGRHLLSLINDLLDLSKIEAGKLELEFETVSVEDICRASLQFVREMAIKKGIQVDFADESPDAWLSVDTRRLKQMLINLLSNAVKFTPEEGKVTLHVSTDPSGNLIHFAVQDTGPGIAPADQGKLFEPFVQLDSHLARQHEGTGLGLTLVKRLAEQHGGTVRLESAGIAGEGSCFTITLPYDPTAHPVAVTSTALSVAAPVSAIPGSGPLLLLVEDNEINVEALKDFLEHAGYRVAVARTGAAALDLADAVAPDLILMDVQLPEMDGLEVTRRLRAKARFAQTPIIALTASAMIGDREQCLAAGATDYLSKPLRMRELLGMIEQLTNADRS